MVISLLIAGCNIEPEDKTLTNPPLQDDLAKVVVSFPIDNPRGVSLGDAKEYTNYYEVIFRSVGDTPQYASANSSGTAIELEILPGTYDILLLAGYKIYSTNLLLASAYEQDRSITMEQVNNISLVLDTFDVVLEAPDEVIAGTKFTVVVSVDTKNPLIYPPMLNLKYKGSISGNRDIIGVLISGTKYNYLITTLPNRLPIEFATPATSGSCFLYLDSNVGYRGFYNNISSTGWKIADYSDSDDSEFNFLNTWYSKTVNFVTASSQPKVTINVSWKE